MTSELAKYQEKAESTTNRAPAGESSINSEQI